MNISGMIVESKEAATDEMEQDFADVEHQREALIRESVSERTILDLDERR